MEGGTEGQNKQLTRWCNTVRFGSPRTGSLAGKGREVCIPAAGPAAGVGPAHGEPGPGRPATVSGKWRTQHVNDTALWPGKELLSASAARQLEKEIRKPVPRCINLTSLWNLQGQDGGAAASRTGNRRFGPAKSLSVYQTLGIELKSVPIEKLVTDSALSLCSSFRPISSKAAPSRGCASICADSICCEMSLDGGAEPCTCGLCLHRRLVLRRWSLAG